MAKINSDEHRSQATSFRPAYILQAFVVGCRNQAGQSCCLVEGAVSADLINLRMARKARTRSAKQAVAAENRAKFGRSKADRVRSAAQDELMRDRHAAHQLEAPTDPSERSD